MAWSCTSTEKRLLLIGMAPSRNGSPDHPLEGRIGKKIAKLMGVSFEEYLENTERVNIFESWMGKNGKGDAFPMKDAICKAEVMLPRLRDREVVFVGKAVGEAFGFVVDPLVKIHYWSKGMTAWILPHPSGVNHWWNSQENTERARNCLTAIAERLISASAGTR